MKICRHPVGGRDAADMLNAWLWPRLVPELCARDDDALLLGAGGLIDAAIGDVAANQRLVVFGAGMRDPDSAPDMTAAHWDIRFVRGPETARVLGIGPEAWLCDPAALAPKLLNGRDRLLHARPRRIGLVPGRRIPPHAARALALGAGLHLIDATEAEGWLAAMSGCDGVICGDPVAAVVADAFGIPWRPLRVDGGDAFEWLDLSRGMGLTPCAIDIPHLDPAARAGAAQAAEAAEAAEAAMRVAIRDLGDAALCDRWSLSDRTLLRLRLQALDAELANLRAFETSGRRNLRLVGRSA